LDLPSRYLSRMLVLTTAEVDAGIQELRERRAVKLREVDEVCEAVIRQIEMESLPGSIAAAEKYQRWREHQAEDQAA
jgi:hypothetical protein